MVLLPLLGQYFLKDFIYLFYREGETEREGEKHQCVVDSRAPPTGYPAHNPGMCPDWESNQQPFVSKGNTQSTESNQPGPFIGQYLMNLFIVLWKLIGSYRRPSGG